jgi:hypothetical protein
MRLTILTMLAALPLLGGCPICTCDEAASEPLPLGEFAIETAWQEALEEGTAVITEETVTFLYTDDVGNEWEIEYAIEDGFPQ